MDRQILTDPEADRMTSSTKHIKHAVLTAIVFAAAMTALYQTRATVSRLGLHPANKKNTISSFIDFSRFT